MEQFFVIEGSCRSRLGLELDGQQFFAIEGSCWSRPALEELDGQEFCAIEGSCVEVFWQELKIVLECLDVRHFPQQIKLRQNRGP